MLSDDCWTHVTLFLGLREMVILRRANHTFRVELRGVITRRALGNVKRFRERLNAGVTLVDRTEHHNGYRRWQGTVRGLSVTGGTGWEEISPWRTMRRPSDSLHVVFVPSGGDVIDKLVVTGVDIRRVRWRTSGKFWHTSHHLQGTTLAISHFPAGLPVIASEVASITVDAHRVISIHARYAHFEVKVVQALNQMQTPCPT